MVAVNGVVIRSYNDVHKNQQLQIHVNKTMIIINRSATFLPPNILLYYGHFGTLQALSVDHLLRNFFNVS